MQLSSPKKLHKLDRPREKLIKLGADALTEHELLQVIIGSGSKEKHVGLLAEEVLQILHQENSLGSKHAFTSDIQALLQVKGLSVAKASAVMAALEFGFRFSSNKKTIIEIEEVLSLVWEYSRYRQEHLISLSLDGANRLIAKRVVTVGTLSQTLIHPREVFSDPIADRAAGIILAHNHPSGEVEPSKDDIKVTSTLLKAAKILGIRLIDHIIFDADSRYYSFSENNLIR